MIDGEASRSTAPSRPQLTPDTQHARGNKLPCHGSCPLSVTPVVFVVTSSFPSSFPNFLASRHSVGRSCPRRTVPLAPSPLVAPVVAGDPQPVHPQRLSQWTNATPRLSAPFPVRISSILSIFSPESGQSTLSVCLFARAITGPSPGHDSLSLPGNLGPFALAHEVDAHSLFHHASPPVWGALDLRRDMGMPPTYEGRRTMHRLPLSVLVCLPRSFV